MKNLKAWLSLAALALLGFQTQAMAQNTVDHPITYTGEVGHIINENCVVCHREDGNNVGVELWAHELAAFSRNKTPAKRASAKYLKLA